MSVAVVIFSVADFRFREWGVAGGPVAIFTDLFPLSAGGGALLLKVVVDFAVAVVISIVADFVLWEYLAVTLSPLSILADLCAGFARRLALI